MFSYSIVSALSTPCLTPLKSKRICSIRKISSNERSDKIRCRKRSSALITSFPSRTFSADPTSFQVDLPLFVRAESSLSPSDEPSPAPSPEASAGLIASTPTKLPTLAENADGIVRCPHCYGQGSVSCAGCAGNGKVFRTVEGVRSGFVCQQCEGQSNVQCPICHGTGIDLGWEHHLTNTWLP